MDDFLLRAVLAGLGVAVVSGPLGVFVLWRRMAFFGDTLAHAALLGIALALLFDGNVTLGIFGISVIVAIGLVIFQKRNAVGGDALLAILSHGSLALGLVAISAMESVRVDLLGFLFGDILAVSNLDIAWIFGGGAIVLAALVWKWRELLSLAIDEELARAEGVNVTLMNFYFMILVALVVAAAMKVVGVLLVAALLIIPAATARFFARTPEQMVVIAGVLGGASVIGGMGGSMTWDSPAGPSIVVVALILYLASAAVQTIRQSA